MLLVIKMQTEINNKIFFSKCKPFQDIFSEKHCCHVVFPQNKYHTVSR